MRRFHLLVVALLTLAPAAGAATVCATDRLGNTVCRAAPAPERREDASLAAPGPARPPAYIPGSRRDAFGSIRAPRSPVTGVNPFGTPPRATPRRHRCTTDSFGGVRCP